MKRTIAKQQKIPFASFERIPGPKHAAYASPLLILQSSLDTLRSSLPEGLHYKRGLFVLVHETISSQTTERSSSSSSLVLRLVLRFPKIAKVFKREKELTVDICGTSAREIQAARQVLALEALLELHAKRLLPARQAQLLTSITAERNLKEELCDVLASIRLQDICLGLARACILKLSFKTENQTAGGAIFRSQLSAEDLVELQETIGYRFKNVELLYQACHDPKSGQFNNNRLALFGDEVLDVVALEIAMQLSDTAEGSKADKKNLKRLQYHIVTRKECTVAANALALGRFIQCGAGRINDDVLAEAYEAVLGAIFRDSGFEAAFEFCERSRYRSSIPS